MDSGNGERQTSGVAPASPTWVWVAVAGREVRVDPPPSPPLACREYGGKNVRLAVLKKRHLTPDLQSEKGDSRGDQSDLQTEKGDSRGDDSDLQSEKGVSRADDSQDS